MFKHIMKFAAAVAFGLAMNSAAYSQIVFEFFAVYSSANGSIQFIAFDVNSTNVAGQTLIASDGKTEHAFTFASDVTNYHDECDAGIFGTFCLQRAYILVATQGFADLNLVKPDFVVPNGFLFLPRGSVRVGGNETLYEALPQPGQNFWVAGNNAGESYVFTANSQGLWWAAGGAEPGWGINFAHSGDHVFATWNTYDTSGKSWWLSMLASRTTVDSIGNTYTGKIYVDGGPPLDNFVVTGAPTPVGNGTLIFKDSNNGVFVYTLEAGTGGSAVLVTQVKQIERFNFGLGPQTTCTYSPTANLALATNYQDLWWAASGTESGWGINLAHQGDTLFATWNTYDTGGAPLWLSALMNHVRGTGSYVGSLSRESGPQFDAFGTTKVASMPVGSASLTFANGNSATFTYVTYGGDGLPAMSQPQTKSIVRFPLGPGGTECE